MTLFCNVFNIVYNYAFVQISLILSEKLANFGEFLFLTLWPNSPAAKKVLHRLLLLSRKRREAAAETELNINVLSTCPRLFSFFPAANFRGKQFRNFLFLPFRGCISGSRKVGEVKVCVHNILQDIEFHTRKKMPPSKVFSFSEFYRSEF